MYATDTSINSFFNFVMLFLLTIAIFDNVFLLVAKKYELKVKNKYFQFHVANGFFTIIVLKLFVVLLSCYFLMNPGGNIFKSLIPITIYSVFVIHFSINFFQKLIEKLRERLENRTR